MLISCYQCRQHLDLPDDSAGKRVRCPHCQYVIVAPAKARPTETDAPALGLPSLELDGDGDRPAATKVSPFPLPPLGPMPDQPAKSEPRSAPPIEEMPEMPSIERGGRRRRPLSTAPTSNVRWGRIIGIGVVLGVVVIGVIVAAVSSSRNRPRQPQVAFNNPPVVMQIPKIGAGPIQAPNLFGQIPILGQWPEFHNEKHRFNAQFPAIPEEKVQNINFTPMTAFEVKVPDWEFTVAHSVMTEDAFKKVAPDVRFNNLRQYFVNINPGNLPQELARPALAGVPAAGRAWDFFLMNQNQRFIVWTFFVPEGKTVHQYVLMARGPGQADFGTFLRFFNSFRVTENSGSVIYEEIDTPQNGELRENEFTVLALHPTKQIAVVADRIPKVSLIDYGKREEDRLIGTVMIHQPPGGEGLTWIEQLVISPDGRWIADSRARRIHCRRAWPAQGEVINAGPHIPGVRCAFTKSQHLLVASKDTITEYNPATEKSISTHKIPGLTIKGFALSADEITLAAHGDKSIELWNWPEKKLLGKIDAHDADITALAFSPDGKTLASSSADSTIKLWRVETCKARATLKQHAWTVWTLAFTPDGKHLASGGLDGMLLLWNLVPDQPQLVWAESHQFPVRAIAFDRDGKHLYFTCKHPVADNQQGAKQYARQLRRIAWADIKPNPQEAERIVAQNAGLHLPTTSVMSYFTPDGRSFVTTTDGVNGGLQANSLRVWNLAAATVKHTHSMHGDGWLSPDGKWFAYGKMNDLRHMRLLEVATNLVTDHALTFVPAGAGVLPFAMFSADSKSLWLQRDAELIRCELETPPGGGPRLVERNRIELRKPADQRSIHIHPALDHQTFLVELRSLDGLLRTYTLYASADGKMLPRPKAAPGDWSQHLALRRTPAAQLELFDLLHGSSQLIGQQRPFTLINMKLGTSVAAIHPQRKFAVSAHLAPDQTVRLIWWDLPGRRPLLTLPESRARSLQSVRFSPDGRYLSMVTGDSWTRILPTDWLMERKGLLPCLVNDVTGP